MEFHTFYQYFLYTKSWAYVMMFIVLPLYVWYWNFILFPDKKSKSTTDPQLYKGGPQAPLFLPPPHLAVGPGNAYPVRNPH